MVSVLRTGLGMSTTQMERRMGVAVRQRERQQHHHAADERGPHHGNEHVAPEGLKVLHSPHSTKRPQGEVLAPRTRKR